MPLGEPRRGSSPTGSGAFAPSGPRDGAVGGVVSPTRAAAVALLALAVATLALGMATTASSRTSKAPSPSPAAHPHADVPTGVASPARVPQQATSSPRGPAAVAYADQPTFTSYSPSVGVQNEPGTADIVPLDATVTRSSRGVYTVILHGLASAHGSADVYPYSGRAGCATVDMAPVGADEHIDVVCEQQGVFTDTPYIINFSGSP